MNKRAKKNNRRQKRKKSKGKKKERQQNKLKQPLKTPEGLQALQELDEYILEYRLDPKPGEFIEQMENVEELNLIRLEDHKYNISAAVATIYRCHPEYQKAWQQHNPELIERALRLYPEEEDEIDGYIDFSNPLKIYQTVVSWLICGDFSKIDQVMDLLEEDTQQADIAEEVLAYYVDECPDLQHYIKYKPHIIQVPPNKQQQVQELLLKVTESPEYYKVVFVAFEDDIFVIGTMDGTSVEGVPLTWDGVMVMTRIATPEEREAYRPMFNNTDLDDPV